MVCGGHATSWALAMLRAVLGASYVHFLCENLYLMKPLYFTTYIGGTDLLVIDLYKGGLKSDTI